LQDLVKRKLRDRGIPVSVGVDEPDYLCFLGYAEFTLGHIYKHHGNANKVNFVVSIKQKVTHRLGRFHEEMSRLIGPPLDALVGDLIPARMEKQIPLQAADVLCWHLQRYWSGKADGVDKRRMALLGDKNGFLHEYTDSDLDGFADSLIARVIAGGSTR